MSDFDTVFSLFREEPNIEHDDQPGAGEREESHAWEMKPDQAGRSPPHRRQQAVQWLRKLLQRRLKLRLQLHSCRPTRRTSLARAALPPLSSPTPPPAPVRK